jgi:hypothetical protein
MADLKAIKWDEFPLDAQPEDQISANFKFYELTRSETASRLMIDNSFTSSEQVQAAAYLCRNVLQQVRNEFGPFVPNSVFRSQELERALKKKPATWISESQHTRGQACDIEIPGLTTMDLANWVIQNLEFDQVICECFNRAKGPNSGWVHVSLVPPGRGDNRHAVLSYVMSPQEGKYIYLEGLHESV